MGRPGYEDSIAGNDAEDEKPTNIGTVQFGGGNTGTLTHGDSNPSTLLGREQENDNGAS